MTNHSCNQISTLRIGLFLFEPVTYATFKEHPRRGGCDFFLIIMRCSNGDKNRRDQEKHCQGTIYNHHLDNKQRKTNL